MRMKLGTVIIAVLAICVGAARVTAHHAFAAEFDANKPVSFKGTITKMEWVNPHTWLHVDVKNPDGSVREVSHGAAVASKSEISMPIVYLH